jgi:hypothetical protein
VNEEAMAHWGLLRQNEKRNKFWFIRNTNSGTSMNIQIHYIFEETQVLHTKALNQRPTPLFQESKSPHGTLSRALTQTHIR